jgi:predicted PP-loop superfamily ATPase
MKVKQKTKRCRVCGLPYPGVLFNKDEVCNYCIYSHIYNEREKIIKSELKKKFTRLIRKTKEEDHRYDCIVAYSGGKDSTFLLYYLKKSSD